MGFFLVLSMIFSCSIAYAHDLDNTLDLKGGKVAPENGVWGDNFTFKVTYEDNENNLPVPGYPKVYIDWHPKSMMEDDPLDNDVTDGKLYKYEWASTKENVGSHIFYFYAEDNWGDNDRDPEENTYDGPNIGKRAVLLKYELSNPNPSSGDNITFDGSLKTLDDNLDIAGENLVLYEVLSENIAEAKSATTDENGNYSMSLIIPNEGIYLYVINFAGSAHYERDETGRFYVNSLNKPLVLGVAVVALLVLVLIILFFLSRGVAKEHLSRPLLIAFVIGILVQLIGPGFIALLAAGGLAGYMYSRRTEKWTEHLRIGVMVGTLLLLVTGAVSSYVLVSSPQLLGFIQNSISQAEVFRIVSIQIIYLLVLYNLLTGIGSIIGGMFRGFLG